MNIKKINWDAVIKDLKSSISNERAFANGSSPYERAMHEGNILRMEAEIECIKNGNYAPVIDYYDKEFFEDFIEKVMKSHSDRLYDFKCEVIKEINETVGDKEVDLQNREIKATITERHCGEVYEEYIESVSKYVFKAGGCTCRLEEMSVADLCLVLDYLLEKQLKTE